MVAVGSHQCSQVEETEECFRTLLLTESWAEDSLLGELPHILDDPEHPSSIQLAMDIVPEASLPGHSSDGLVPMNGKMIAWIARITVGSCPGLLWSEPDPINHRSTGDQSGNSGAGKV